MSAPNRDGEIARLRSIIHRAGGEIARLRSIIHRAESEIMAYNTRRGIEILNELNATSDNEPVAR